MPQMKTPLGRVVVLDRAAGANRLELVHFAHRHAGRRHARDRGFGEVFGATLLIQGLGRRVIADLLFEVRLLGGDERMHQERAVGLLLDLRKWRELLEFHAVTHPPLRPVHSTRAMTAPPLIYAPP